MARKKKKSSVNTPQKKLGRLSDLGQKLMQAITGKNQEKKPFKDSMEKKKGSIKANENITKKVKSAEEKTKHPKPQKRVFIPEKQAKVEIKEPSKSIPPPLKQC